MKRSLLPLLTLFVFTNCFGQQQFQLAPPVLKYNSAFFITSAIATLQFKQAGTQIFYTLNGKEPTRKSTVYQSPVLIKKSLTTLKAKVFGARFLPSETVQVTFIKDGLKIKSIEQSMPDEKYPGNGARTLFDNKGGIADMHSRDFFGYQQDSVEIKITLEKKQKVTSVLLDFLQDNGSRIFLPQNIKVYYFNEAKNSYGLLATKEINEDKIVNGSSTTFELIKAGKSVETDNIKIIIVPLQSIPANHAAKGKQSWLFIDEVKIY